MSSKPLPTNAISAERLCRALVIIIPILLVSIATLNVFYSSGDMVDLGLCSIIAWHNGWRLLGPAASPMSFFNIHISPIYWLANILSYMLPLTPQIHYALCLGFIYALFAAGICRLWRLNFGTDAISQSKNYAPFLALAAALAATFSAVGMQALRLPHIEMAMPALALWFFIALLEGQFRLATLWFVLCLMVREDAGLHLFGLLLLWGAAIRFSRRPSPYARHIRIFAAAALGYAIAIILIKHFMFPGMDLMTATYIGAPPWGHLTADLLKQRFWFFLTERTYITLSFLLTLGWAIKIRNPLLPLGYAAALPWLTLNLIAAAPTAGVLGLYYAFPFWLALGWPLLALRFWPDKSDTTINRWMWLLVLLVSLIGWQDGGAVVYPLARNNFIASPFTLSPELFHQREAQAFVNYFAVNSRKFGDAAFDGPVISLTIGVNDHRVKWIGDWSKQEKLPRMIIYFDGGYEELIWVAPYLQTGDYNYFYTVPETKIRMAAKQPLSVLLPGPTPFIPSERPAF